MKNNKIPSLWLTFCAFMVMAMTGIGAVTRLTESGLSITEWNVVSGALPPLSEESWQDAFQKYQATPEFVAKHHWMNLSDFKQIFFWEWFHRLWGRLIGLAFALPLLFFWVRGDIQKQDRLKYLGLLALGGSQGFLGWFMVQSGLVDRPSVSHFRLAAHLSLALIIYCALLWMAWRIRLQGTITALRLPKLSRAISWGVFFLAFTTIVWGAFVAGLDAGMIYNSFPMMGESLVPPELGKTPFFYDPASIQFTHRCLAILTGLASFVLSALIYKEKPVLALFLCGWVLVQIGLGIATLLSVVFIPLAVAHQISAVILLTILLYIGFVTQRLQRQEKSSLQP
ncbi:MAG TPA: COX15/CtaA family protein [Alphaproteobacteria bacterium]|nr:COX15/CtaA family protein [Alphaproteobacteria bacterium]HOO50493.1 COX15/CtaA family protein [Alphaproteobacteria bacterium]